MIDRMKGWWLARTAREQVLLAIMAILATLVLGWLAIIRPLSSGLESAKARHEAALVGLAQARSSAASLAVLKSSPPPPLTGSVAEAVKALAGEAGFQLSRADPVGDDGVIISIVSAKTPAFLDWMAGLERRGLYGDQVAIRPNSDATVSIDARLKARAR